MTSEQLEKLAQLIADKVSDKLEKLFEEEPKLQSWEPMSPQEFFHHQVDGFGNIKHINRKVPNLSLIHISEPTRPY